MCVGTTNKFPLNRRAMQKKMSFLEKPWRQIYFSLRVLLWGIFLTSMCLFSFSILFPSSDLSYSFSNSGSKTGGNKLERPRSDDGALIENGKVPKGRTFLVDAPVLGDFSRAQIHLSLNNASDLSKLQNIRATAKRSQQAFFYPKGSPAAFPEGSLLRDGDTFFLIDPNGSRRSFPSEDTVRSLGYDPSSFLLASDEELSSNPNGDPISVIVDSENPPEGAFIRSDETYYLWKNKTLFPFVSSGAFLERFPQSWALVRDAAFIKNHTVSEEWIGYPSGSLLAWGDGVFLMDQSSPRPILGADIFLSLGYSWEDVRSVSDEEISFAQRGKFVDISVPHPNGTVFFDTKDNRYFLVDNGALREIRGDSMLRLWLGKKHPVEVSSDSFERESSCTLADTSIFSDSQTSCSLSIENLASLQGDTYEFSLDFPKSVDIDKIDIVFESSIRAHTLIETLSKLKSRILSRYGISSGK